MSEEQVCTVLRMQVTMRTEKINERRIENENMPLCHLHTSHPVANPCNDMASVIAMVCPQGVFYGELFGQLGLVLGTSQDPVSTYFIEPAFVNSTVR